MQTFLLSNGLSVVPFPFAHNWASPVAERVAYLTPTLRAFSGKEQRFRLRTHPRRTLEYVHLADAAMRVRLEVSMQAGHSSWFALPIWTDARRVDLTGKIIGSEIQIATALRDFEPGGLVMIRRSDRDFELAEIHAVTANAVTLKAALTKNWNGVCTVVPCRVAALEAKTSWQPATNDLIEMRAIWRLKAGQQSVNRLGVFSAPVYNSKIVYAPAHDWSELPVISQTIKRTDFDFEAGLFGSLAQEPAATQVIAISQTLDSRAAIGSFLKFLDSNKGAQKSFYLDLPRKELTLTGNGALSTRLYVERGSYATTLFPLPHRRLMALRRAGQAALYLTAIGAIETTKSGGVEVDEITVGSLVTSDAAMLSFLRHCRFESSEIEIAWLTNSVATVNCSFQEIL